MVQKTVVIIGNDKGGVGKDVTAEGTLLAAREAGLACQLIEIESQKRLSHLYSEAAFIEVATIGAQEIYVNPDALFAPMDALSLRVRSHPLSIVCLGANLTRAFLAWSETNGNREFGDGAELHFVCVLTMNRAALAAGLDNLYDWGVQYPSSRRTAILNEYAAAFIEGDKHLAKRLKEAEGEAGRIETIRLTRMAAPAWGYIQNLGPLGQVAQMPAQKLIDLGLPEGPSIRSMALFEQWISSDLVGALSALLPEPENA